MNDICNRTAQCFKSLIIEAEARLSQVRGKGNDFQPGFVIFQFYTSRAKGLGDA